MDSVGVPNNEHVYRNPIQVRFFYLVLRDFYWDYYSGVFARKGDKFRGRRCFIR